MNNTHVVAHFFSRFFRPQIPIVCGRGREYISLDNNDDESYTKWDGEGERALVSLCDRRIPKNTFYALLGAHACQSCTPTYLALALLVCKVDLLCGLPKEKSETVTGSGRKNIDTLSDPCWCTSPMHPYP